MPLGDGTGPEGKGPGTGRGTGSGTGRGRMGGDKPGSGPGGKCVCPSCGTIAPHTRGIPCSTKKCPKCGARMTKQ
ncbi:MAG: hypothetical protein KKF41_02635 [Actinobacteria bacterium]|nr:hypothetical protein [Actinomycetota bacterium]MBU2686464.1 hypothetical protein [Actinomycetota bacterium]